MLLRSAPVTAALLAALAAALDVGAVGAAHGVYPAPPPPSAPGPLGEGLTTPGGAAAAHAGGAAAGGGGDGEGGEEREEGEGREGAGVPPPAPLDPPARATLRGLVEGLCAAIVRGRMRAVYHALSSDTRQLAGAGLLLLGAVARAGPGPARGLACAFDWSLAALPALARPPRWARRAWVWACVQPRTGKGSIEQEG